VKRGKKDLKRKPFDTLMVKNLASSICLGRKTTEKQQRMYSV